MKTPPRPRWTLVQTRNQLEAMASRLSQETVIGADLEADSMYHYQEKVCLIQVSTGSANFIVDPLAAGEGLGPLAPVFENPAIQKVFHGADYDMRSLRRDFGIGVRSLFDTQMAARFLGMRETGLADLLREKFGFSVEKKHQKADWSRRPLPDDMLAYAVLDVTYLPALAKTLSQELEALNRMGWVKQECEILSRVQPAAPHEGPLFLKFKGAGRLGPEDLAVLEEILQFRDHLARNRDRPHFKVLGSNQILALVEKKPTSPHELQSIRGMTPKLVKAMGNGLVKGIRRALALPPEERPSYPRRTRTYIPRKNQAGIKALKLWRDKRAEQLNMDPALVCSNSQINAVVSARPQRPAELKQVPELRDWQRKEFGKELFAVLEEFSQP